MIREEKDKQISELIDVLTGAKVFYLTGTESLNAGATSLLRRECFKNGIKMRVVKNTLLQKALERIEGKDYSPLYPAITGNTAVMIAEVGNVPARVIKEFRKKHEKPTFKAAFVQDDCYVGENQFEALVALKSKNELLGEILGLLQSPARNVISALQSNAGNKIAGLVKTLEERNA